MSFVLPGLIDRYRGLRNGKRKYTGQIFLFDSGKKELIAHVYGDTLEVMRKRKRAVEQALDRLVKETA